MLLSPTCRRGISRLTSAWLALAACASGIFAADAAPTTAPAPQGPTVLFERAISGTKKLVILRGPDRSPAVLKGTVGDASLEQLDKMYTLSAELQPDGEPPVVLASHLVVENRKGDFQRGVVVLD